MIELKGRRVRKSDLDHEWVEDVLYFDGPLLSLFKESESQDYFYYWVDSSRNLNRWMAIPVSRSSLSEYRSGEVPLLEIVLNEASESEGLVFVDIDRYNKIERAMKVVLDNAPSDYLPPEGSYFDADLSPNASSSLIKPSTYELQLNGGWFIGDLTKIPRLYRQLYAFFYTVRSLEKSSVRQNFEKIVGRYPWRGGFSRVNFFEDLARSIPSYHELRIARMDYASPGVLELELLQPVARNIQHVYGNFGENEASIDEELKLIRRFLKERKLSRPAASGRVRLTRASQRVLRQHSDSLSQLLQLDVNKMRELAPDELVLLKMLVAVATRMKRLSEYTDRKMISI